MSKIMKALREQNRPTPLSALYTVSAYRNIGDAINAVTREYPNLQEAVSIALYPHEMDCDAPANALSQTGAYSIDCGREFLGYVLVWVLQDGSIAYTKG